MVTMILFPPFVECRLVEVDDIILATGFSQIPLPRGVKENTPQADDGDDGGDGRDAPPSLFLMRGNIRMLRERGCEVARMILHLVYSIDSFILSLSIFINVCVCVCVDV